MRYRTRVIIFSNDVLDKTSHVHIEINYNNFIDNFLLNCNAVSCNIIDSYANKCGSWDCKYDNYDFHSIKIY